MLLGEEEPCLCHLRWEESLQASAPQPQVWTKGRNGVRIGEEARRGGGAIRTAPLGKRLPAGIPRYLSAASDSIRPSTITWLTWIDFGPYSLATDCWAHDVCRSGGKRVSATSLDPIGKQGR